LPSLCGTLRLDCAPARNFKGMLQHLGYRVSHFHREPSAIKTDAPNGVVFDVLRKWAEHQGKPVGPAPDQQQSGGASASEGPRAPAEVGAEATEGPAAGEGKSSRKAAKKQKADPLATKILEKAISTEQLIGLDFDSMSLRDEERPRKVPRFLPNPEKFWGPKPRAKPLRPGRDEGEDEERQEVGAAAEGQPEASPRKGEAGMEEVTGG